MTALRYDERPPDRTPIHTPELPDTPTRDRNIMASAWIEAPPELLSLGEQLDGQPEAEYKRRIGEWLLWRSGPATDADAVYLAINRSDAQRQHRFVLEPDGSGSGEGPSGRTHTRFRDWKTDLLGRESAKAERVPLVHVSGFDHLVLTCVNVETTLAWYIDRLGLAPVRVDEWRAGTAPFPSIRINEHTIIDLIPGKPGADRLDHFCIVVAPTDLQAVADSGMFDVVEGPATRYGAQGNGTSLYVRDPDGTVVELRYYAPA